MGKANPHRGEVSLSLGGRDYKLVPTYANLSAVEEGCGMGLIQFARKLTTDGYQLTDLARILAAVAEPEISVEDAGEAIIRGGVVKVAEAVTRFLILLNPALVARLQLADSFWEIDQTGMGAFSFAFEEVL